MRNAESRFADSTRRAVAAVAATLFACASLALAAVPASAEHVHGPVNFEFGQTGKPTSTFGETAGIAYDQGRNRLYIVGHQSIFAYSNPSPGTMEPLPAPFPLLEKYSFHAADMAVDNTDGPTAGDFFFSPGGYRIEGWNPAGEPLPGFEGEQLYTGEYNEGLAIDNERQFYTGNNSYEHPTISIFGSSGGGQIGSINTAPSVGTVSGLAIDPNTDDLWVSSYYYSKLAHYTRASGLASFTEVPMDLGDRTNIAINAARHVLYVGTGDLTEPARINAYSTDTGQLLDSFQLPGGRIYSLTVEEATDTLFVSTSGGKVKELRAVLVPKPTTGEPVGDATVGGTADPDGTGNITECFFEFGETASYGSTQPCDQALPFATTTPVTATFPGLTPETDYHYRLVLGNVNAQIRGADQTVTPHDVKGLRTDQAAGLKRTEATLAAHYEGTNKETHFHFEWELASAPAGEFNHSTPDEIKPAGTGNTPLAAEASGLTANTTYRYRVVASNELGTSTAQVVNFTTQPAVKDLATSAPTAVTPTSATLQGTLDPDGFPTTYYFEYGQSTAYGQTIPALPGKSVEPITPGAALAGAEVTGLQVGSTYHYRIVAVNSFGTTVATNDRAFTTAQPPSVNSFTSRNVTANSAELVATINPNEADTEYRFEYGTTLAYGSTAPTPEGTITAASGAEEVKVDLSGLQPTTYHFRVVAKSKWGTTTTGDQTFNFFPAECPNAHLREQTGASHLPDCRAYELVSPSNAENVVLSPDAPLAPGATSPARFAFSGSFGAIAGTGEPQVNNNDLYVATRTPNGWVTKYVGIPATVASRSSGPPNENSENFAPFDTIRVSADLSKILVWIAGDIYGTYGRTEGSNAPFIRTSEGTGLGRLPSDLSEFPGAENDIADGGFVGDVEISKDFSHFIFSSRNFAFAEGGLTSPPGSVYSDDLATGKVELISKTPQGTPIPQDSGDNKEYIEIPGVSADGSHVLMSTKGPNGTTHLYMAVEGTHYYDVSEGTENLNHAVHYVGMTEDGSTVYFTSSEPLTADDNDNSTDLFVWKEGEPATVTRVSTGSNGSGNTDSCPEIWTSGCNVAPVSTGVRSDNAIAAEGGDIYFYSPELLAGSRGIPGARNLYRFAGGEVQFVATFTGSDEVDRIQVSPKGDHVALITRTPLTSALTAGHKEMYSFDPEFGDFQCVSCKTNGELPEYDVEGSQNGLFMSDDGRTFFSTLDALVPQDTDGLRDSYEFVDSRAQLLSTGTADRADRTGFVGVSSDGVDAYFSTLESMVPQDTIGPFLKFYDARTGGGIPFERVAAPCAAADECHGAEPAAPAKLPGTTGASLGTGGNLQPTGRRHHPKKGKRKKKHGSKRRDRHHNRHPQPTTRGAHNG